MYLSGRRVSGLESCAGLATGVLQIGRAFDHLAGVAWDCFQILVNRAKVVVGHVLQSWPRHHLEDFAVKGRLEAVGGVPGDVQFG